MCHHDLELEKGSFLSYVNKPLRANVSLHYS